MANSSKNSKLIIVESPAKAKTIEKYLGSGHKVLASMGHLRDLPRSMLGVDVNNNFQPRYMDMPGKSKLIKELRAAAEGCGGNVLLATDPDREGEAISWHLAHILDVDLNKENRVVFNEITKSGVKQGMDNPRKVDMNLVNAQQARRILDRLVGYKLSPFLWKTIRKGLSAGRVQSVVLKIIVDREKEIRAFVSEEYWSILAKLFTDDKNNSFEAKFFGNRDGKMDIPDKKTSDNILAALKKSNFILEEVKRGKRNIKPAPPFITSTLQQDASRKLRFAARRTMKAAQELYEGVEVPGQGAMGLITYMRTDSIRISNEARAEGCDFVLAKYGEKYLPKTPRVFKTKKAGQDGHEAIRPTSPSISPDQVRGTLTDDQYKLYRLIWERFMASLMSDCVHDTCQMTIGAGDYVFRASGYTINFDGFTVLYTEGKDESGGADDEKTGALPPLKKGITLNVLDLLGKQHFTQPPARYSEATLIKAMEENGIGRPSTYAPTIGTITAREYVERDGRTLAPTVLGEVTTELLAKQFPDVVDVEFTATMEKDLDEIDEGNTGWIEVLSEFYGDFAKTLERAEENMKDEKIIIPDEVSDVKCEHCGKMMIIKSGRFGKFLACPGYPECKNTQKIVIKTDGICPKCGGDIIQKQTKRRRAFYGCSSYPDCDFVSWNEPSDKICPECNKTLFKKKGKNPELFCISEDCGHTEVYSKKVEE